MSVQRWMARSSRPLVAGRYRLIGCQNGVSLFEREATPMKQQFVSGTVFSDRPAA